MMLIDLPRWLGPQNVAKIAGARWPVLIDSLLSSDPHVVLIKSGMLPCAPRPSRSDSHALESANLFISCFMEFARKGIHPADRYWKAAKRMLLFMCRSPTSRFAEGIDICLASTEESLTLDIPVLSIPEVPQSEPKVVDTRRGLSNIPPTRNWHQRATPENMAPISAKRPFHY
jgi:hypothetical protein